ncbi:DUF962 domain-containing protein [Pseudomonas sp. LP_7_YM]|uniref:Mpo1 family 2-hydroxy fatty acid dioxygenase n=1 Tax=Pseudomonas sp. LP_7_YM TaxID=2485137 RepID=UPI00105B5FD6|nr:Mpo1-like protein [Pseudomonas sp. LP_7_YM]TDV60620.1 putative membrane protein YGL010W [Pseudomonas sp. LP_7_YM]
MKNLIDHLSQYAAYHRDMRNIITHFVGIPLIVLAVAVLLSRPGWSSVSLGGLWISPALLATSAATLFYLRLDRPFGVLMGVLLALCLWAGACLAQQTTMVWLSTGIGLFVVGWVIQFIGHYYEGRKPAFVDDLSGLIIGPLFVVAEAAFLLGMRSKLQSSIEGKAGRTHKRNHKKSPA